MIRQKNITVPKTARYFLSSPITGQIEEVWFVCHGYGQLASYFIRNFEVLDDEKVLVVAAEGLHRFYLNGFSGRVVASWMTKEERIEDITDYVNYLDSVYSEVMAALSNRKVRVNVLGFSQGTATVCRWLANKRSHADNLVLWAGAVPADLEQDAYRLFEKLNTFLVVGDNDEFIKEEDIKAQAGFLDKKNIRYELLRFSGKHAIHNETLKMLAAKLKK